MSYSPFPGRASPVMPQQVFPVAATPQPQATQQPQITPGTITYTTTMGPDGQMIYHPFRAVAASYQTPQGIVSGIQWVPAEATNILPAGATPANQEVLASFNRPGNPPDGAGAMREWQKEEEKRRRKEKERREREREREEDRLRRAREKDTRAERRERRPSFNAGYPANAYPSPAYSNATADLERQFQDLDVGRRDREYEREGRVSTGHRSRRSSYYGDRAPGYQPAPGGPQYPAAPGGYPSPAPTYTGSPQPGYTAPYAAGGQYMRPTGYPPSPRSGDAVPRPVSPYAHPATGVARPVSPYQGGIARPVSPYHPGGMARPVSPYHPGGMARPVSPYHPGGIARSVSPYQQPNTLPARPVSPYQPGGIGRAASPRPGPAVYPPGHIMEGQPIRRPLSRAPSPAPPGVSPYANPTAAGYGAVPQAPYGTAAGAYGAGAAGYGVSGMPGGVSPQMPVAATEQMLSAPEGFSRPPNLAQPYTHFEMMKIQDMDDFLETIPRMPLVLVPHDVYHDDWIRLMKDLSMAWSGRLPVPEYDPNGRPPKRTTLTADLIDLWNYSFFMKRGVELVLYKGRERRTGRNSGTVDLHLPGFDTEDISSPSESDSDPDSDSDDSADDRHRYGTYGGIYGRQVEGQMAELREARRMRRERRAEKAARKREKKRRAKRREMEKKYALYLACTSPREGGLGPQM